MSVELLKKEVTETKEASELAGAIEHLVLDIKEKSKDGLKIEEIVAAVAGGVEKVVVGVQGIDLLDDEAIEHPGAFTRAWTNSGTRILDAFVKKGE